MDWSRFAQQNQQAYNPPQQAQPAPSPQGTAPLPGMGAGPQMPFGGGGGSQGPFGYNGPPLPNLQDLARRTQQANPMLPGGIPGIPGTNPMSGQMNSLLAQALIAMGRQNQPGGMQAAPPGYKPPFTDYLQNPAYGVGGGSFGANPNVGGQGDMGNRQPGTVSMGRQIPAGNDIGIEPWMMGGNNRQLYPGGPFGLPQSNPMAGQMNALLMQALFAGGLGKSMGNMGGGGPFGGGLSGTQYPVGSPGARMQMFAGRLPEGATQFDPTTGYPIISEMGNPFGMQTGGPAGGPSMVNQGGYPAQPLPWMSPGQSPYPY